MQTNLDGDAVHARGNIVCPAKVWVRVTVTDDEGLPAGTFTCTESQLTATDGSLPVGWKLSIEHLAGPPAQV